MSLFIPTSKAGGGAIAATAVAKGQIYNLDLNEYFEFQFNPQNLEWEREFNWSEIAFKGSHDGGDLQYLGTGPRTFDLPLLFVADLGAPGIRFKSRDKISSDELKFDFEAFKTTIERWESRLPGLGRPSRVRIIYSRSSFVGVFMRSSFRIVEMFPDSTVREVLITLSFREWTVDGKE